MRFLTAEWRNLILANYTVDPEILKPRVPVGTKLDLWDGQCLVSLVGFMFEKTRVLGIPVPFHRNFEEVNLRFYVKRQFGNEWRRGVVFIKEIVPRFAIAAVARVLYRENYVSLPMRHEIVDDASTVPKSVEYQWKHSGQWNRMKMIPSGPWQPLVAGSQEEFITEHYFGYTPWSKEAATEYQVEHPRWNVAKSKELIVECDATTLYGEEFASTLSAAPASAFLAQGSAIVVHTGERIS